MMRVLLFKVQINVNNYYCVSFREVNLCSIGLMRSIAEGCVFVRSFQSGLFNTVHRR